MWANAFAERWVRSVKQECLSKLILFGEASLQRALNEYIAHFHGERNHQGKGNILLFPDASDRRDSGGRVECKRRLGGLLRYYIRAALNKLAIRELNRRRKVFFFDGSF